MNLTSFADVAAAATAAADSNPTTAKGSGSTDVALLTSPTDETENSNVSYDADDTYNIESASQTDARKSTLEGALNMWNSMLTSNIQNKGRQSQLSSAFNITGRMEADRQMELIAILTHENHKLKKEAKAMNHTCRVYQKREQERKAEVVGLRAKLEEIHSMHSKDSSNGTTAAKAEDAGPVVSFTGKEVGGSERLLAVSELEVEGSERLLAVSGMNPGTCSLVYLSELEATLNKLKIVEVERDIIKAQLEAMKAFPPFTNAKSDPIVADLRQKLEKVQKQYIDVVTENHVLTTKLRSLNVGVNGVPQFVGNTEEEAAKQKGGFFAKLRIKRRQRD